MNTTAIFIAMAIIAGLAAFFGCAYAAIATEVKDYRAAQRMTYAKVYRDYAQCDFCDTRNTWVRRGHLYGPWGHCDQSICSECDRNYNLN